MHLYNIVKMILFTNFYTNYSICLVVKKFKKYEPCHQVCPRSGGHRSVAEGVAVFIGGSKVKRMKAKVNNYLPFWSRQLKNPDLGSPFGCGLPIPELNERGLIHAGGEICLCRE